MSATRSKTDAVGWPDFDPAPYDLEPGRSILSARSIANRGPPLHGSRCRATLGQCSPWLSAHGFDTASFEQQATTNRSRLPHSSVLPRWIEKIDGRTSTLPYGSVLISNPRW